MQYYIEWETMIGTIRIVEEDGAIVQVGILHEQEDAGEDCIYQETELLLCAKKQLEEYLAGTRQTFDLPLHAKGTAFQQKVWEQLQSIPYGETRSYGQIAAAIGNPKASRAVGGANNKNPIAIIIPCHRVIGANGALVGYAGGLTVKETLLALEKRVRGFG